MHRLVKPGTAVAGPASEWAGGCRRLRRWPWAAIWWATGALSLAGGCSRVPEEETAAEPISVSLENPPPLGDLVGPLDEGRIEVAAPRGWYVPPRSDSWIIRFQASRGTPYPTILLSATDHQGVYHVTAENVAVFAERRREELAAASPAAAVEPVQVGGLVGAAYRLRGEERDGVRRRVVERIFLETVVAGRMYTFELRTLPDETAACRPYLMAVAAGAVFLEAGAPGEEEEDVAAGGPAAGAGGSSPPGAAGAAEEPEADGVAADTEGTVTAERPASPRRWRGEAEYELIGEEP